VADVGVIINPRSGRAGHRTETGEARAAIARRILSERGRRGEVVLTRGRGHGAELAAAFAASGARVVIAWGGDGTINEVSGPLIGTSTALGVVRSGSGNGLARSLGVPREPAAALRAALEGAPAPFDVGYLGHRHFLNVAGIGFDAHVGAAFNARSKRGLFGYVTGTLAAVWNYRAQRYTLSFGDRTSDGRFFLVAFANGPQYGGNLVLAADADPQDGWLETVVMNDGSPFAQLWRTRRLRLGVRRPAAGLVRDRVQAATVSGSHLVCHVDGEVFEAARTVDVRVASAALRVVGSARLRV
jgi:diacylglycerol kinase (ATP)